MTAVHEFTQTDIEQFLYREARLLDDREFEQWLECYHPDAEYWMPAWDDDGTLTENPQTEISLIYYPNRGGLEDRVFRIRTDRSSATSLPEPRTGHNITNVEILERRGTEIDLRPQLQIHTDDVRASHGATTGALDENMRFYLHSRGLDAETARALLEWAFVEDAMAGIDPPELRAATEQGVAQALASDVARQLTGSA